MKMQKTLHKKKCNYYAVHHLTRSIYYLWSGNEYNFLIIGTQCHLHHQTTSPPHEGEGLVLPYRLFWSNYLGTANPQQIFFCQSRNCFPSLKRCSAMSTKCRTFIDKTSTIRTSLLRHIIGKWPLLSIIRIAAAPPLISISPGVIVDVHIYIDWLHWLLIVWLYIIFVSRMWTIVIFVIF